MQKYTNGETVKKTMLVLCACALLFIAACAPQPVLDPLPVQPASTPQQPIPQQQQQPIFPHLEPTDTKTDNELAFDLSIDQANPLDFDPAGPFYHIIYRTSSTDGLSFEGKDKIFEHTSVPDVIRLNDGRIALYGVDGYGRSKSGLIVAFSDDDGKTWTSGSLQLASNLNHQGAADPEVVLFPDGTIRMFYVIFSNPNDMMSVNEVWSATSTDGIHFVEENSLRFKHAQLTDPDVAKIGDTWFIYFAQGPKLVAASSSDGKTFTVEKTIRDRGSVSNTVQIENNKWRQYYCEESEGIKSATSSDGLTWKDDSGIRVRADAGKTFCDPAPIKTDDGWVLFYKVSPLMT